MAFFCGTFADATTTIKMHLLEDHATRWANATHIGFGLLGEQGAESIYAKFNQLYIAPSKSFEQSEFLNPMMLVPRVAM